jgi:ATP-dependent Clp protease protease subunit
MDRIIFLGSEVNSTISNIIVAQLLFLESIDKNSPISIYINSPGGEIYSGLSIYDTMQFISPEIVTVCTGLGASMAAVLLSGGSKGKRFALRHSRIMIHQPLGGAKGQASDMEINLKQILDLKKELYEILAYHTGKSFKEIEKDSDRDYWMTSEEAKNYGIIDDIFYKKNNK